MVCWGLCCKVYWKIDTFTYHEASLFLTCIVSWCLEVIWLRAGPDRHIMQQREPLEWFWLTRQPREGHKWKHLVPWMTWASVTRFDYACGPGWHTNRKHDTFYPGVESMQSKHPSKGMWEWFGKEFETVKRDQKKKLMFWLFKMLNILIKFRTSWVTNEHDYCQCYSCSFLFETKAEQRVWHAGCRQIVRLFYFHYWG